MFKSQQQSPLHTESLPYVGHNQPLGPVNVSNNGHAHQVSKPARTEVTYRPNGSQAPRTLFVGDLASHLKRDMSEIGYQGKYLLSSFEAYCYLKETVEKQQPLPEAIVCDFSLRDGNAKLLWRQIKTLGKIEEIPFLILSKKEEDTQANRFKALKLGFDEFLVEGISGEELDKRITFLHKHKKDLIQGESSLQDKVLAPVSPIKRAFDIAISATALIVLSPLLIIIALLIWLDSPGPIFYISKRVGRGYHIFDFYKFRSMRINADKEINNVIHLNQYIVGNNTQPQEPVSKDVSPEISDETCLDCLEKGAPCSPLMKLDDKEICTNQFNRIIKIASDEKKNIERVGEKSVFGTAFAKIDNDPRITTIGKFLRMTSLDELPQLLNVLKGDMSIVGNRPLPLYEAEHLTVDQWSKRFLAPAGITGLWQVTKRGRPEMSKAERLQLDAEYADSSSMWYDLKIIFRTLPAMIQKEIV